MTADRNESLYFRLSKPETTSAIVLAIPDNWAWVDGYLATPSQVYDGGRAAATGFRISNTGSGVNVVGMKDGKPCPPDILGLIMGTTQIGFVQLDLVGYGERPLPLKKAQEIIATLIQRGYGGWATFYRDSHRNERGSNSARCNFQFGPWKGPPAFENEAGSQPARVKLDWDPKYQGSRGSVAEIEAACREFNLADYTPVAAAA